LSLIPSRTATCTLEANSRSLGIYTLDPGKTFGLA